MEMIVVTTSATNDCIYCVVARGSVTVQDQKINFWQINLRQIRLHMFSSSGMQMLNFAKVD